MTNTNKIDELLKECNNELLRVWDFINENESALLDFHDLKLHDVSYYCYKDLEKDFPLVAENMNGDDLFSWFCDETFSNFKTDLDECGYNFDTDAHYINRTSKFYFSDIPHNGGKYPQDIVYNLLAVVDLDYSFLSVDSNGKNFSVDYSFNHDEIINGLTDIKENLYKSVYCQYLPCLNAYKVLKAYKDSQINMFKDFLQCYEDNLEEEREDAKNTRIGALNTLYDLQGKYNIPIEDLRKICELSKTIDNINTTYNFEGV